MPNYDNWNQEEGSDDADHSGQASSEKMKNRAGANSAAGSGGSSSVFCGFKSSSGVPVVKLGGEGEALSMATTSALALKVTVAASRRIWPAIRRRHPPSSQAVKPVFLILHR